jgi:hypothetical protein
MRSMGPKHLAILCTGFAFACTGCKADPSAASSPAGFAAVPNSTANLNWVRYTDSAEGAFSMDVPLGWQIQGGMYRFGYFDVRWMMDARSLDGKIILRIDDPNIPPYVLPGPHTGPAGRMAVKPQQYQTMVANYQEALPYAETYARHRFSVVCQSFTPRQTGWTLTLPPAWQSEAGARVTQATVAFDCPTSDGPRIAEVFARNTLHPASGLWQVDVLSLIAAPDVTPLAQSMIQHMIESWQESPQWKQYQDQMTQMGLDQIRVGFGQFLRQMQAYHQQRETAMNQQVAHFESQQHAQAQQVSGWGETLTGLTNLRDTTTGQQFQVFSGPKSNYYTNGNGVTINSNLSPGAGFHQVEQVGP